MRNTARVVFFTTMFAGLLVCSGVASANYINGTTLPPATGPTPDETCLPMGSAIGSRWSYCDVASGLFSFSQVDMALPGPMPIVLRRIYRSEALDKNGHALAYPFGNGANFDYNMFLWSESEDTGGSGQLQNADLILPNGERVFCACQGSGNCTPGSGLQFQCKATPSQTFYGATIQYVSSPQSWLLTTKDHTKYTFSYGTSQGTLLQSIADRFGNQLTLTRGAGNFGDITEISSSNGRYINLTYTTINGTDVITQAKDNANRITSYGYTTYGNTNTSMTSSVDLNAKTTNYTWYTPEDVGSLKPSQNSQSIEETDIGYTAMGSGFQFAYLTPPNNQGYFQINYTMNGSKVSAADIYDPQVLRRHLVFSSSSYLTSEALNYGGSPSETTTYTRDSTRNFVTDKVDALGRHTHYGYDFGTTDVGDLLSVTRLYGTSTPITPTFTYTPAFQVLNTITDPLNHTTTFAPFSPDTNGSIKTFQDAVGNTITFSYNTPGQVLTATDAASDQTVFAYDTSGTGDLTSVTDPNQNKTSATYDGAGRLKSTTDPLRNTTSYQVDGVGNVTQITDPRSGITKFGYDDVSNLLTVTDARNMPAVTNTYDLRDRSLSSCDALNHCTSYGGYDADDNLTKITSGTGNETDYLYDNLNRRKEIDYGVVGGTPTSKVTLTYDLGDRLTQAVDSVTGTLTRQFGTSNTSLASGLDFITQEVTPQGTVTYTPNTGGLRTNMTVSTQTPVSYSYDNADKLKVITQGSWNVTKSFNYSAGRLDSITLPNLVKVSYTYDSDSNVKSLTYKTSGGTTLGTLSYGYDADGRRNNVSGTLASAGVPAAQTFVYRNDDSLSQVGTFTVSEDNSGNILYSTLLGSFIWDERGHLQQSITTAGGQTITQNNSYDALGRRDAITQTTGSGTTPISYVWDGLNVALGYNGSSAVGSLLGLGLDELYLENFNGTVQSSVLKDALGSVVGLTSSTQSLTDTYSYEPYGASTHVGTSVNGSLFAGQAYDFNTLYFMRARYYLPSIARFLSRDPAAGGGVNPYLYAGDDPVDSSDPTGLDSLEGPGDVCSGCIGGFVGQYVPQQMPPVNKDGLDNDVPQFYDGSQNGGGLLNVQEEDEPEVLEEDLALDAIFNGKRPILPSNGLLIPTEGGRDFLILRGTEIGGSETGKGYKFSYGRNPKGGDITVRVMGPRPEPPWNAPNGYLKFENSGGQAVDPSTGRTLSKGNAHFRIVR